MPPATANQRRALERSRSTRMATTDANTGETKLSAVTIEIGDIVSAENSPSIEIISITQRIRCRCSRCVRSTAKRLPSRPGSMKNRAMK